MSDGSNQLASATQILCNALFTLALLFRLHFRRSHFLSFESEGADANIHIFAIDLYSSYKDVFARWTMFLPSRKSYRESGGMMNGIQPAHLSSGSTFHKLRGSINSESLIVNLFFRV